MIEQIYNDFTTKLLPTIQEGLAISKDYFMDLFGRYVKYLIAIDSFWMVFGIILMIASVIIFIKLHKKFKVDVSIYGLEYLLVIPLFIGFVIFSNNAQSLMEDLLIPEVRIYQELNNFQK